MKKEEYENEATTLLRFPSFPAIRKTHIFESFFFFFKAFVLHVGGYVLHLKRHTREMDSAWMGTDVMDILFLSSRLV